MSTPAAYISYAWGDDKTPEGLEREAIVDDLCCSFAEVGIVIVRDKNEVKPGDSIEKFGVRIAKAQIILAVISERSLRSEWCMLYELYEAYTRRGGNPNEFSEDVVALVLGDAEADIRDHKSLVDFWNEKCSKYEEMLKAADPDFERSIESRKVLMKYREMIKSLPDMLIAIRRIVMPRGSSAIRHDDFAEIRAYVKGKLDAAKGSGALTPFSRRLDDLPIDGPVPDAPTAVSARTACEAVALVLTPSGQEVPERSYQWSAFIQRAEEDWFERIPNGAIGAKPSCDRDKLPELLQCLRCWIESELEDPPLLEIFAPDDLLHEDWGSISLDEEGVARPLHSCQPFLLRSSDRLLNRRWNIRRGALKRMHRHLVDGTGAWLPLDNIAGPETLEDLDGQSPHEDAGYAVVSAIYSQQSAIFKCTPNLLRSMLKSRAPLVVWPSRAGSFSEEQLKLCFLHLSLVRKDASQADMLGIPHCPDLAHLAKLRHLKLRQQNPPSEWDLRGLTILVDHPERSPDSATLQNLFSSPNADPARAPQDGRPDPSVQPLISS
jgi:hypothetical protein